MSTLVRAAALCLVACAACEGSESTQVIVTVTAERVVLEQASELRVTVHRNPGSGASVVHDTSHAARFPYVIALSPESEQSGTAYSLEVSARSATGELVRARLESSYVPNQTRYVVVPLEDACIGVVCAAPLTCHAGACVDSRVDPSQLASDREHAPRSTDLVAVATPASDADAATPMNEDPGMGLKPNDGGVRPGEAGTSVPGAAEGGTHNPPLDAGPAAPSEAGAPDPDSGPKPKPPDAGPDTGPPDAGNIPFPCTPTGSWVVDYTETGGDCGLGDYQWLVAFNGKLTDILVNEAACAQAITLTPDGCAMTYTLDCPAHGDSAPYEETSTLRMVAPDRMVGEVDQLFIRPERACRTLGKNELRRAP